MTGDYITHDYYGRYRKKIVNLIGSLQIKHGIFACLGNHDYGFDGLVTSTSNRCACEMAEDLAQSGVTVLRNKSSVLEIDRRHLWFVGTGDLWADDFKPDKAFEKVSKDSTVITLSHNPACVEHLKGFNFDAAMCGHTHGAKFQFAPSLGWPILNQHSYHSGMYDLEDRKLYVNRGLGRLGRFLFNARPEITVFNLC